MPHLGSLSWFLFCLLLIYFCISIFSFNFLLKNIFLKKDISFKKKHLSMKW